MLYLVATPIGNLEDISKRALSVLEKCDAILCEDTRRTSILLQKYELRKTLIPFHKFNERGAEERILEELRSGKEIALVSDAGTPCINDPGQGLVQACVREGLLFTAIPGPCSLIQALVLSGFDSTKFQFVGFLPRKGLDELRKILCYPGTSIGFESPERLVDTLRAIGSLDAARNVAVAREMTKTFEECRRGTASELADHYEKTPPKGEIVLLVAGGKVPEEEMPLDELLELLQELHGLSLKEAIKLAAKLKNLPKSAVYKQAHKSC
ncbi:MAG: 16S rRNA (cytidine(1402)-2'-O)-methyltransferase [Verrucomicrobia bacterium]|nr:16S rRNA (cytidine(1402)-2'-O)-methyltransferase [Verrucomicrobiota bacterium]